MFILDSLMINGISWAIRTVVTAAEAEMNDDTALREQLLAAEMQREMGEITDEDFKEIERDLLGRIREIKERREGGSGPLAFGEGEVIDAWDTIGGGGSIARTWDVRVVKPQLRHRRIPNARLLP